MSIIERTLVSFVIALMLGGCAGRVGNNDTLNTLYQKSIADAAVKRPEFVRPLVPIDKSAQKVRVVHIQKDFDIDTKFLVWVTQPDELRAFCRGKPNPLLAMQQALGLPPDRRNDIKVFTFEVHPSDLFRPCASSPDITSTKCALDLPLESDGAQAAAEHFVLKQMMDGYRSGFQKTGYPFTAMGWSYNWDPESPSHQGVSEYVVKLGAEVFNVASSDPTSFCQAP